MGRSSPTMLLTATLATSLMSSTRVRRSTPSTTPLPRLPTSLPPSTPLPPHPPTTPKKLEEGTPTSPKTFVVVIPNTLSPYLFLLLKKKNPLKKKKKKKKKKKS